MNHESQLISLQKLEKEAQRAQKSKYKKSTRKPKVSLAEKQELIDDLNNLKTKLAQVQHMLEDVYIFIIDSPEYTTELQNHQKETVRKEMLQKQDEFIKQLTQEKPPKK